ncbi:condensation domain-containing protein [Merismopedia glauca]|uniref:Condensation protein n=1 Tax=Merismopedia glauca CCAP 1448/3 TaxID=1296344 RepID=A0A2T1C2Z6_9CYAN|nr:condensation domain-containing protein [Merismopedia glauca]PSB02640.1 condensation protein [Merismopedia glauca CCAP 1448/3]
MDSPQLIGFSPITTPPNPTKSAYLSLAQQRLWSHEQSEVGTAIYNIPVAYHLSGEVDVAVLEQSLREIFQRHEVLRTRFGTVDGQPVQIIAEITEFSLPVVDLSSLSADQQEGELKRLEKEEAETPFSLTDGALWRFQLISLGQSRHVLLVNIHHIVSDRWSLHLLMQEAAVNYKALIEGQTPPLPPLPKQYADFAQEQQQWLQGSKGLAQLTYWEQQLAGNLAPLQLPSDRPRSFVVSYQGARQSLELNQSLTSALKQLSDRLGVTLFITLLTAFQTLLYQYTQQEDMLVCSPVAGRHRFQTKELIGYFINILPLRSDLSGDPTLMQLMNRVGKVVLGAYKNLDVPFQAIADLPNLVRTPLTRGFFALQPPATESLDLPGIGVDWQDIPNGTANFDLSLFIEEKGDLLTGWLDYKTDLFEPTTIREFLDRFATLLESLVANPEEHLSGLPCLRKAEPTSQAQTETVYIAPQKEIERTIAAVWQQVLHIDQVSIEQNFFDLGGHSLLVAKVISQLREKFNRDLSTIDLFKYPTIRAMAQYLSQESDVAQSAWQEIQDNAQRQKETIKRRQQLMKQRRMTNR